ncbi:MAG: S1 RNA-binding domain-containing protein [Clostridia bacterium]
MCEELIGATVSIAPEELQWFQEERCIRGRYKGLEFIVPTEELALQVLRWDRYEIPGDIKNVLKNGLTGIVKSYENKQLVISRKEWQHQQYSNLRDDEIYWGKIYSITPDSLYVNVNGLQVRVHATECSRSRMNNLFNYFEKGKEIKVKIIEKDEDFPYWISGSRKQAYPDINESKHEFKAGEWIIVTVTEHLDEESVRVEVTPNIPGIMDVPLRRTEKFYPGRRIRARVKKIVPKGIRLSLT